MARTAPTAPARVLTPLDRARTVLGAIGVGFGLWGVWLLVHSLTPPALLRLPLWLAGAVLVDDFFLIPLTVAVGWALARWSGGRGRRHSVGAVRVTLLYVGLTTLVALPLLLRQGKGANPTVLPRDYLRDWLLLEGCIVLAGLAWLLASYVRRTIASHDRPPVADRE